MLQINLICTLTTLVILFRYLLYWFWNYAAPDFEIMIIMFSLAVGLRFGEDKVKKAKELFMKLKKRFGYLNSGRD